VSFRQTCGGRDPADSWPRGRIDERLPHRWQAVTDSSPTTPSEPPGAPGDPVVRGRHSAAAGGADRGGHTGRTDV